MQGMHCEHLPAPYAWYNGEPGQLGEDQTLPHCPQDEQCTSQLETCSVAVVKLGTWSSLLQTSSGQAQTSECPE